MCYNKREGVGNQMKYTLKNGKTVIIRKPVTDDAVGIIKVISTADCETKFLSRNEGEFSITEEQEKEFIQKILNDENSEFFVSEYERSIVGTCSVGLVSNYERHSHRAEVTFVVLKDYCGLGIGGKMMQRCIGWCRGKNVSQIELTVVSDNKRAITMYENFGFKPTGTIPKAMHYPDGTYADELMMVLEL